MTKEEFDFIQNVNNEKNELEKELLKTQEIFKEVLPNCQLPVLTSMEVNILRESLLLHISKINGKLSKLNSKIDSYFNK